MDSQKEIKELRDATGMNRREFSDYYGIPYRTVQDWEAGKRTMPEYVLRIMKYKAEMEKCMRLSYQESRKDYWQVNLTIEIGIYKLQMWR